MEPSTIQELPVTLEAPISRQELYANNVSPTPIIIVDGAPSATRKQIAKREMSATPKAVATREMSVTPKAVATQKEKAIPLTIYQPKLGAGKIQ